MSYTVKYAKTVAKQIKKGKIPKSQVEKILAKIKTLAEDPLGNSEPVKDQNLPNHRFRIGVYRALFNIDEKKKIINVILIKHRKDCYD